MDLRIPYLLTSLAPASHWVWVYENFGVRGLFYPLTCFIYAIVAYIRFSFDKWYMKVELWEYFQMAIFKKFYSSYTHISKLWEIKWWSFFCWWPLANVIFLMISWRRLVREYNLMIQWAIAFNFHLWILIRGHGQRPWSKVTVKGHGQNSRSPSRLKVTVKVQGHRQG